MKRQISIITCLVFIPLFLNSQTVTEVLEYGYNENGYGARALSMGQAFVPIANDYSALYWNPAGLGQINKEQLYFELSGTQIQNSATFQNQFLNDDKTFLNIKALGFVYPLTVSRGSFVIAGGYQQRKDFNQYLMFSGFNTNSNSLGWILDNTDVVYPFDTDVRQTERVYTEGGLGDYTLGASVAVTPNLLLGASLFYRHGNYKYHFNFLQEDVDNNYNTFPANYDTYTLNQQINANINGWGAKIGALMTLVNEHVRLGATIELPSSLKIHEDYNESDQIRYDDGYVDDAQYEPGQWEYTIDYPWRYSAGIAFVTQTWTVSVATNYTDISQARYAFPDGQNLNSDNLDLLEQNNAIAQNLHAYSSLQLGLQYQPDQTWPVLRAGYRLLESPLKDSNGDDYRHTASLGAEFDLGNGTSVISSYTYSTWKQNSSDDLTPGNVSENVTDQKAYVGLELDF